MLNVQHFDFDHIRSRLREDVRPVKDQDFGSTKESAQSMAELDKASSAYKGHVNRTPNHS